MDLASFRASLPADKPPTPLPHAPRALWLRPKGGGDGAHDAAQADEGGAGDWVHAYLHRKEGDASNAAYWYRRARKPFFGASVGAEWRGMARNRSSAVGRVQIATQADPRLNGLIRYFREHAIRVPAFLTILGGLI